MNNKLEIQASKYVEAHGRKKRWHKVVTVLAAVVIFCTTYALIMPAVTMQGKTYCGMEEHIKHTDECYKQVKTLTCKLSEEGHAHSDACYEEKAVLTCDKKETNGHTHDSSCYAKENVLVCTNEDPNHVHGDSCYETKEVLICDKPECEPHHHDESCYTKQRVLTCGLEASEPHKHTEDCYTISIDKENPICGLQIHKHSLQCYSNPDADVETASVWEKTFASVKLTGNWREDILAIAETQLGYAESEKNYEVQEDGTTMKGYTRYGDWYGDPYGDWCAMFCSFCLNYADVDSEIMPIESGCDNWVKKLSEENVNLYHRRNTYDPEMGDLVFFDWDSYTKEEDRGADHVGIVAELIKNNSGEIKQIKVIEGNSSDKVKFVNYDADDNRIMGYGSIPEQATIDCTAEGKLVTLKANYKDASRYNWQWQVSEDGVNWRDIPEAKDITYSFVAVNGELEQYYRVCGLLKREADTSNTGNVTLQKTYSLSENSVNSKDSTGKDNEAIISVPLLLSDRVTLSDENITLVVAGSDFQDPATSYTASDYAKNGDYTVQTSRIKTILTKIQSAYGNACGFIGGGDYNFDEIKNSASKTLKGVNGVKGAVTDVFGSSINTIFVQGNHDALSNSGVTTSGAHDTDDYGVFVMNENEYRSYPLTSSKWSDYQQSESIAKTLANSLDSYLSAKVEAGYNKPIFITSHVPLHFSTRTKDKGDAIYADDFYNVITKYGDDLNIIFLYGHNHAWGDDDYLGGSAVFLTRGDTINIAEHGSQSKYTAKPLNFTYMNYGYTGYYWSKWASNSSGVCYSNADDELTMTAFVISGSTVTISRWDENGMHPLKSVGVASQGNRGIAEVCTVTTNTYASPQTVTISTESTDTENKAEAVAGKSGVLSQWDQLTSATIVTSGKDYNTVASLLGSDVPFTLYDITKAEGATVPTEGVKVYLPAVTKMRVFGLEDGKLIWHDDAEFITMDGQSYMCFKAYHFSIYGVAGDVSEFVFPTVTPNVSYDSLTSTSSLSNGDKVIIENNRHKGRYLSDVKTQNNDGLQLQNVTQDNATLWTVEIYNNSYYLKNSEGKYLRVYSNNAELTNSRAASITYEGASSCWQIKQGSYYSYYLNDSGNTGTRAAGYGSFDEGSRWSIYKVVTTYPAQLAVQKVVTKFNSYMNSDTEYTFRLTRSDTNRYANSGTVTGGYTIYNADNSVAEEGTLDNGTFKLRAGQTALFDNLDTSNYYFVAEAVSENIKEVIAAVNGNSTDVTLTGDSNYQWVPVSFTGTTVKQSLVKFTNILKEDTPYLNITLNTAGSDEHITNRSNFDISIKTPSGDFAVFESYQYIDSNGEPVGDSILYDSTNPAITICPGQTVQLVGLADGDYVVHQELGGNSQYVKGTIATVNQESVTVTREAETSETTFNVHYSGRINVEIIDRLQSVVEVTFDYGDGTFVKKLTNEEGHIIGSWPTKTRSGMEFYSWRTLPDYTGTDIPASEQEAYTFTQDTTLYAHWTPFTVEFETDATLTKELRESTAYNDQENPENLFDIDLEANLPDASDQTIVLVFDLSSSMDVQCAVCGGIHGNTSKTSETHDTYYQGEIYNGVQQTQETVNYCKNFTKRLPIAKEQAVAFIQQLKTSLKDNQNCYIEIVGFAKEAWEVLPVTNLAETGGDTTIINAINGMKADSGTNIASGLKMGYEKLTNIVSTYNLERSNSYVVLLSDGAPTTNNSDMQSGYSNPSSKYYLNAEEAVTEAYKEKWKAIWSQYDHYRWDETGFDTSVENAKYYNIRQVMATPYYADKLRDFGAKIYTVAFGVNMDYGYWKGANNFKYVGGIGIDNFDYVKSFSDQAQFAVTGDDLGKFYSDVINSVSVECTNAVISDPMSEDVEFLYFTDGEGSDEIRIEGNKVYDGTKLLASYNPDTRTITWEPGASGRISYKVRLKNEVSGFKDWEVTQKAYLTNGITTFNYDIKVGNKNIEHRSKTVDIPHVHGWLGELEFLKVGGLVNDETAKALANIPFTLHHDKDTCPLCQHLLEEGNTAEQLASIADITVISDKNGYVSFANVPSGHTYTMTEKTPEDYSTSGSYRVKVAYGKVTVTAIGDDNGYWSKDNEGNYRLFNPYTGAYELPETGGMGTRMFYVIGGTLVTAAAVVFITRKRIGVEN